jgi:hypothetical protein
MFLAISLPGGQYGQSLSTFERFWQALNHAITGLATGGFSVTDDSIGAYNSPLIEGVLLRIMALGAIAFPVHCVVLRDHDPGKLRDRVRTSRRAGCSSSSGSAASCCRYSSRSRSVRKGSAVPSPPPRPASRRRRSTRSETPPSSSSARCRVSASSPRRSASGPPTGS